MNNLVLFPGIETLRGVVEVDRARLDFDCYPGPLRLDHEVDLAAADVEVALEDFGTPRNGRISGELLAKECGAPIEVRAS